MDLIELDFPVCWDTPPPEILRTIQIAERLREQRKSGKSRKRIPLLVNSNYYIAYHALKHVLESGLGGDLSFCEWGSGLGVVTCIASQLGFRATGIEIEESLCVFARTLTKEACVNASFIQANYRERPQTSDEELSKRPFPAGQRMCNLIYVYPWPAETVFIESLFECVDSSSAILISYHGGTTLRARTLAR